MSEILKNQKDAYARAANTLSKGGLVILPTETVYGLAGLASDPKAIERIYTVKSRPKSKPLSIVTFSRTRAEQLGEFTEVARQLADRFWPGPLTLVLTLKNGAPIHKSALAGNKTVGIRTPKVKWVEKFNDLGFREALVLPSANTSGRPAPTNAQDANKDIGDKVDLILDTGQCETGVESTIISVNKTGAKLLRIGAILPEDLAPFSIDWA